MEQKHIIVSLFLLLISSVSIAQPAPTGTLVCGRCGFTVHNNRPAMLSHTCSKHGLNCPAKTNYYPPIPTKSPEQIRKEREEKDLKEAAEDANDQGVEYYEKKDWTTAINYFKVALEYVPGFEDAIYNLKKAEEKLEAERQRIENETVEKQKQVVDQGIQTINLPPALNKYMEEADKIIVPPPSWESNIEEQVRLVRLGQTENDKYLLIGLDQFVAAFDQVSTLDKGATYQFKILLIGARSTFAAQDEAEIVAFRQNAWYERTLQVLKDKKQGPLLIAAIKAVRENKPMPAGISPELVKMAKATQDPALGNSSVHMAMDAMLSKESKAAFFQTFKMGLLGLANDEIKGAIDGAVGTVKGGAWKYVEERIGGLKEINSVIGGLKKFTSPFDKGATLVDKDHQPIIDSIIKNKIDELEKNIQPIKPIPEAILDVMSFFSRDKTSDD